MCSGVGGQEGQCVPLLKFKEEDGPSDLARSRLQGPEPRKPGARGQMWPQNWPTEGTTTSCRHSGAHRPLNPGPTRYTDTLLLSYSLSPAFYVLKLWGIVFLDHCGLESHCSPGRPWICDASASAFQAAGVTSPAVSGLYNWCLLLDVARQEFIIHILPRSQKVPTLHITFHPVFSWNFSGRRKMSPQGRIPLRSDQSQARSFSKILWSFGSYICMICLCE